LKLPVVELGMAKATSATLPPEFLIVMTTPVFVPGGGDTTPVITIGWMPEYAG